MGVLVPAEFPMASLQNDEERLVVETLCDRLTDGWLVLPAVGMSDDDRDREIDVVGDALDALEDRDHAAATVLVATLRTSVRNRLREDYAFVGWESRDPMAIVCENVHRIKGLEYDHVILVAHDPDGDVSDELLYVGASRAVMSLTVIGAPSIGDRLGLTDQ